MQNQEKILTNMLRDLELRHEWISSGFVDAAFVAKIHNEQNLSDAQHLRTQCYAKFFSDRRKGLLSNQDIDTYLELTNLEPDITLRSWAIGFLVECRLLTLQQLTSLRQCDLLQEKYHVFLEREIERENLNTREA